VPLHNQRVAPSLEEMGRFCRAQLMYMWSSVWVGPDMLVFSRLNEFLGFQKHKALSNQKGIRT